MKSNFLSTVCIILALILVITVCRSCAEQKESTLYYQERQEAIDDYNERHKDEWNGYKGTRRNSWAEDQKLKHDGIDPDEYRKEHGY